MPSTRWISTPATFGSTIRKRGVRALLDAASAADRRAELMPDIGLGLGVLSYDYHWRQDKGFPWTPIVIFDDGERVFLKLPAAASLLEQPLLLVGAKGLEQVMNYVVRDGFYVVDGLFEHARLVLSRPAKATLFRRRRQKQSALHIWREG